MISADIEQQIGITNVERVPEGDFKALSCIVDSRKRNPDRDFETFERSRSMMKKRKRLRGYQFDAMGRESGRMLGKKKK